MYGRLRHEEKVDLSRRYTFLWWRDLTDGNQLDSRYEENQDCVPLVSENTVSFTMQKTRSFDVFRPGNAVFGGRFSRKKCSFSPVYRRLAFSFINSDAIVEDQDVKKWCRIAFLPIGLVNPEKQYRFEHVVYAHSDQGPLLRNHNEFIEFFKTAWSAVFLLHDFFW